MTCSSKEKGSITLETSIVLPFFLFMFMFIYGLFSLVTAQNMITHALVQSTKSLSLDAYLLESLESAGEKGTKFWGGIDDMLIDIVSLDNDRNYTTRADWYKASDAAPQVTKDRFLGYLTGGDEDWAGRLLDSLGVVEGLNGLNFKVEVDGRDLTVTVDYKLQYWFDFMDFGEISMHQSVKSRLWGDEGTVKTP